MKKYILGLSIVQFLFAGSAYAFEESSEVVLKFRGLYNTIKASQTGLPAQWAATGNQVSPSTNHIGKLYAMSVGTEASASVFLNPHIAAEAITGFNAYRGKGPTLSAIENGYSATPMFTKKRNLFAIPSALLVQYHVAPYGAIRPYVGAGYHYTFLKARAHEFAVGNGYGPVMQAGIDVVFQDDTYINLDIKRYVLSTHVKYKLPIAKSATGEIMRTKLRIDPISVGIGIGFKL